MFLEVIMTTNYDFNDFLEKLTPKDKKQLLNFLAKLSSVTPVTPAYEKSITFDDSSVGIIGKNGTYRLVGENSHLDFSTHEV